MESTHNTREQGIEEKKATDPTLVVLNNLLEWNQKRVNEWHKTCRTNEFDNGKFWEAKDHQMQIMFLYSEHARFYSKSAATYETEQQTHHQELQKDKDEYHHAHGLGIKYKYDTPNTREGIEALNEIKTALWELGHTTKDAGHIIKMIDSLLHQELQKVTEAYWTHLESCSTGTSGDGKVLYIRVNKEYFDQALKTRDSELQKARQDGYNAGLADGTDKPLLAVEQMLQKAREEERENILTVGWHKGEMDFCINCSIDELDIKQMHDFRVMVCVAIGQAENMWRRAREKQNPATVNDLPASTNLKNI